MRDDAICLARRRPSKSHNELRVPRQLVDRFSDAASMARHVEFEAMPRTPSRRWEFPIPLDGGSRAKPGGFQEIGRLTRTIQKCRLSDGSGPFLTSGGATLNININYY